MRRAATGILAFIALSLAGSALAAKGDTLLVSRQSASAGGDGANSRSFTASISRNGRFVAFTSEGNNLGGPTQTPGLEANVYVYDTVKERVKLVSRRSQSADGLGANEDSRSNAISGNGRFVAFRTEATNLGGPINANANDNIYVYDRKEKRVQLVSRRSNNGKGANAGADNPSISHNGRFVCFNTFASNLGGPTAGNGEANVYVHDRRRRLTTLASRRSASQNGNGGNGNSFDCALAGKGPVVAFSSQANNLGGPIHPGASEQIYVHDWRAGRTELVSRRSQDKNGKGANSPAGLAALSGSGRHVVFYTDATNLGGPVQTPMGGANVYRYDRKSRKALLVTRRSASQGGAGGDASSDSPSISSSGRHIAFHTQADNLGGPVEPGVGLNVYAYDVKLKKTRLVSRESGGGPGGDDISSEPEIAAGGRFVAFATNADNLGGPVNTGGIPDPTSIYRFDLLGP